jgi:hypothetical protein
MLKPTHFLNRFLLLKRSSPRIIASICGSGVVEASRGGLSGALPLTNDQTKIPRPPSSPSQAWNWHTGPFPGTVHVRHTGDDVVPRKRPPRKAEKLRGLSHLGVL